MSTPIIIVPIKLNSSLRFTFTTFSPDSDRTNSKLPNNQQNTHSHSPSDQLG